MFRAKDAHGKDPTEYAIKVCEKMFIQKERKVAAIMREKQIMNILNQHPSPFFVKLLASFQDETRLCKPPCCSIIFTNSFLDFVMNYASNGELLFHMQRLRQFDDKCTKFYSAEIILALEHIHKLGIIHRDLKPENILLNDKMHIQITDFGSATIEDPSRYEIDTQPDVTSQPIPAVNSNRYTNDRRSSFVGTAQYVSPEVLSSKKATNACDIWALGCIMFQMISGKFPFRAATEYLIFKKIQTLDYSFPDDFDLTAKSLIKNILVINPEERIGVESFKLTSRYEDIRRHEFFAGMDCRWESLHQEIAPLEVPAVKQPDIVDLELELTNLNPGFSFNHYLNRSRVSKDDKDWVTDPSDTEFKRRLEKQEKENEYHSFVEGNLILKSGILLKTRERRIKVRRRMFLLTTGPGLYYVDPKAKILKGFVPWSPTLSTELRDFRKFYIHTVSF